MNYERLKIMYNHLLLNVKDDSFDISKYSNKKYWQFTWEMEEDHKCGTIGCIIGHCVKLDWENVKNNFTQSLFNPINRMFEISILYAEWSEDFLGINCYSKLWDFLFSPSWSKKFNSRQDALTRMRFLIETRDTYKCRELYILFIEDFFVDELSYSITEKSDRFYIPIEYHQHSPYQID